MQAFKRVIGALLFLLGFVATSHATTIVELEFEDLVEQSELIFTGQVTSVETVTEGDLVYSFVIFSVEKLVKGIVDDDLMLRLQFLGGKTDALDVAVEGQFIPAAGDRGLFFVSDADEQLINPLTGWSQGYFPLLDVQGEAWLDLRNHPDYNLVLGEPDPMVEKMRAMNVSDEEIAARLPLLLEYPLDDFLAAIEALMQEQGAQP